VSYCFSKVTDFFFGGWSPGMQKKPGAKGVRKFFGLF
jgi:hypothetical protein